MKDPVTELGDRLGMDDYQQVHTPDEVCAHVMWMIERERKGDMNAIEGSAEELHKKCLAIKVEKFFAMREFDRRIAAMDAMVEEAVRREFAEEAAQRVKDAGES